MSNPDSKRWDFREIGVNCPEEDQMNQVLFRQQLDNAAIFRNGVRIKNPEFFSQEKFGITQFTLKQVRVTAQDSPGRYTFQYHANH